jgi:hypothetical protein
MDSRYDLEEYVGSMERPEEDIVNLLKAEMLWELIQSEWERAKGLEAAAPVEASDVFLDDEDDVQAEETTEETPEEKVEQTDADLLKELEDL